jgi:phosphate transport system substrate-binding protein
MQGPFFPLVRTLALAAGLLALTHPAAAADAISGAGSSAAAPVYQVWAAEYARSQGATLNYEPIGSGAGMARINKREVDFGASDVIASPADLKKNDLVMFPTVITGVVPVVNLPRVGPNALRLTGELLARIYLGQVTQWDAPEIKALNPGLALPSHPIRLIARSDGSGTTYHFSDYLSRVSPAWKQKYGVASHFDWIAGTLAVKGSGEVSKTLRATPDAIAYIDYNYTVDDELAAVSMKNADGQFVTAGVEGFREAVMHSAWYASGDFSTEINELPGSKTWPITMGTYVAVPRVSQQAERTERALRFITWSYLHGDALARQARFVPLPEKVQASAYREIAKVSSGTGELIGAKLMGNLVN